MLLLNASHNEKYTNSTYCSEVISTTNNISSGIGDAHKFVNNNNCTVHNVCNGEIPTYDVDSHVMCVDPSNEESHVNTGNSGKINPKNNGAFQFQDRKRGRAHSSDLVACKKLVTDSGLPLQNSLRTEDSS
ncbi:hypothetical protein AVEN_50103-1 [Araneus ventricosus]|uniref:Uncharacterized protein n=1 Tax=Araneus ventricosus TaxID=182803 RepID=A0A4Y2FS42_ARAVE|nr:hypothetical protein AVEN_50103-1 [Araneus ventricosus]